MLEKIRMALYKYYKSKDVLIADVFDYLIIDMKKQKEEILRNKSTSYLQKLKALFEHNPNSKMRETNNLILADFRKYYPQEWEKIEQFRKDSLDETVFFLRENNWSPWTSVQLILDMVFHGILSDNQKELKREHE
ncbi:MAG: division inhibitor protein [Firmicutes bacterium]|nr:division inhibitor protein [Bacillota bacterium]